MLEPIIPVRESLTIGGELVALKIARDGLPRKERNAIQAELKRLKAFMVQRAVLKNTRRISQGLKPREFDLEQMLVIPYEAKDRIADVRRRHNLIVNAGETFLRDAWIGTVELEIMKYHGCGTGTTAAAEGNTALETESTTVLNPENRATGSLTNNGANIFRTVGTLTFDGAAAVTEWGLFSQSAHGGGTLWSRVVFAAINVANADSIQFTYDLTIE